MINFVFLSRSTFRILYPFSRRKSSDWIYSNKAEEMSHARKGQIFIGSHTGSDTYDCTLRMHQALTLSHIVLSSTPKGSIALLTSLGKK